MNNVTNDYICPNPNIKGNCGNRKENIILNRCDICDEPHLHMKCSRCKYEWCEFLKKEKC